MLHKVFDSVKESSALVSDIVRVKHDLQKATNHLALLFRRLGSATYEAHLKKEENPEISALLEEIDLTRAEMDILYAELYALQGQVECDACHHVASVDCDYCPKCGNRLFYSAEEAEEAEKKD